MLATDNTEFLLYLLFILLPSKCIVSIEQVRCFRRWQKYRFRELKTSVNEEECVVNAVPKSMRYKNKWTARIFEE